MDNKMNHVAFLRTRIDFIDQCFAENEVSEIWITFPDPQPQKNRARKRLTNPDFFLNRYKKILKPGGLVHLKTDSTFFYEYTINMAIKRLPHKSHFYNKLIKSIALGTIFLIVSLAIGVVGYHYYFNITWLDSLVNASMILTGMGPVDRAETDGAKWFSSIYAIYSGVAFLTSVAVIFGPIVHRFLHQFKIDIEEE